MQEWMAAKKPVSKPRPGRLELKNNSDSLNSEVTDVTFTSVARQSSLKQNVWSCLASLSSHLLRPVFETLFLSSRLL